MYNPLNIKNNMNDLYSEDIIIDLKNHMNNLKGMVLLDADNSLFVFEDYHIESKTSMKGLFKKKQVTEFYIKWVKLSSDGNEIIRDDNLICSMYGIHNLMGCHERWTSLQSNLIKLCTTTGVSLNFSNK